jgi:hypothetical protein
MRTMAYARAIAFAAALILAITCEAATLKVGANETYKTPSAAAAVAKNGDRVEIAPGEYFD